VTKISSVGLWVPVHDEEWDQDVPVDDTSRITPLGKKPELGVVTFEGSTLPWTIGQYEVSHGLHHHYAISTCIGHRFVTITMASTMC
jgi:phosphatidylethanolamine N-methyltransferase